MAMRIEAVLGDITREQVDATVNAANQGLAGGGGREACDRDGAGGGVLFWGEVRGERCL